MALSDTKILKELEAGNIIIDPFDRRNLSTSSYDVTLGEFYFREQEPNPNLAIYNIYNKNHTDRVWGTKPQEATLVTEALPNFDYEGIKETDKVILIRPGETILAHTQEFIGGRNHITTMMKARSSMGRNFIEVCKCAGWGDVGYTNRWTMEITNNSRHYTIPLVVGRRIAQIIFFETGSIEKDDYTSQGKYNENRDIEKTKISWDPTSMLPKLYKEREIREN